MSFQKIHRAVFWGETSPQIYGYALSASKDNAPDIQVVMSFSDNLAHLSYFIERTDWLHLPSETTDCVRSDYLWEQNCLECFFEFDHQASYLELNFAPSTPVNLYNLYQFDDYRTPDIMPPRQAQGQIISKNPQDSLPNYHAHHLTVFFDKASFDKMSKSLPTAVNPCVILYQNNQPIFYAPSHANPPDFHNKNHWQSLSL